MLSLTRPKLAKIRCSGGNTVARRGQLTDDELKIINVKVTDEEAFKKFERGTNDG